MNWSQTFGILRIVAPAAVGVLAYLGLISSDTATNVTAMILTTLGSAAISGYANTTLNLSKTVAAVPGLQVHVDKERAPAALVEAADNRNVPDIVPAVPPPSGYSNTPTTQQRR